MPDLTLMQVAFENHAMKIHKNYDTGVVFYFEPENKDRVVGYVCPNCLRIIWFNEDDDIDWTRNLPCPKCSWIDKE